VSRTNISVLLATALLGVLLWVVISIVRDLARAPEEPLPFPIDPVAPAIDPSLPRITSRAELEQWLRRQGGAAAPLIDSYNQWLLARGYNELPELTAPATNPVAAELEAYAEQDDATLLLMAGRGDIRASQELASRTLGSDPLAALDWYDQAVVNGSVFSMVRMADLLATLASPELTAFSSDPERAAALKTLQTATPPPAEQALAWALAAVTLGGYPVFDAALADRIARLSEQLGVGRIALACETAQSYVLDTAAARRAQGGAVFSTSAPPLAVSIAQPSQAIPCPVPVLPLVSLQSCESFEFIGDNDRLMALWLCPAAE